MPRYYFDLHTGKRAIRDEHGTEFPSLDQASEQPSSHWRTTHKPPVAVPRSRAASRCETRMAASC